MTILLLIISLIMSSNEIVFRIERQPKQKELYNLYEHGTTTIDGYGGARGGSKSHGGRQVMLTRRAKYENTNCFIIRKTLDDLRDNHIRPMLQEYPALADWYNKQEKVINLPNGSWIRFISSDNYDDIFKLYGKEAADIFVDQAEQFSQEQIEFLTTINRCTKNDLITPKMLLTFNPGNIGHSYLKRVFVEKQYEGKERATDFAFLQAYGWDNVEWVRKYLKEHKKDEKWYYSLSDQKRFDLFVNESDYGRKLDKLPDDKRRAELLGDWDVFAGQFFSMFRRAIHRIPQIEIPEGWNKRGAIDYGQRTVLEVAARDYDGRIINFAECYTEHATPGERARTIADYLIEMKLFKLHILCDTNMDINLKEYTGYDKTPLATFREVFEQKMGDNKPILTIVSKRPTESKNYRVVVNEAYKEYLSWEMDKEGKFIRRPRYFITENCPHLLKTMPELVHPDKFPDGLDFDQTIGIDDPYDAAKYSFIDLLIPKEYKKLTAKEKFELQHQKVDALMQAAAEPYDAREDW